MEKSKVSIIIPVYNKEQYLKDVIHSIKKQTYQNYEIIIINDGSTDNSLKICENIAKNDNKIKVINQENKGVSTARNIGIQNSSGEYIIFIDADDIIEENYLEELLKNIKEFDLVICGYKLIKEKEKKKNIVIYSKTEKSNLLEINDLITIMNKNLLNNLWNKIFKAEIIRKNKIQFIPEISLGEDTLFILEYLQYINTKIKMLNIPLYNYTLKGSGINLGSKEKIDERINRILFTKKELCKLYESKGIYKYKEINDEFFKRIIFIMARYIVKKRDKGLREKKKEIKNIIKSEEMKEILSNTNYKIYSFLVKRNLIVIVYILLKIEEKGKK